ncbi:hypothetical protein EG832_19105 [bacterium]|nr:hypothetical protein [bacterium]
MKEAPLIEAALENVEALVDAFTDNEILKSIPVVGTALKIIKGAGDIRDRLFAAKLMTFLRALEKVAPEIKEKIRQRVAESPNEAKRVGETVLLLLDRLADLDKADIIAKVFIAYTYGHLKSDEFQRVAQAVDQAFVSDLSVFLQTHNFPEEKASQAPYMQSLYPSGLTKIVGGKTFDTAGELYFQRSALGNKLINAYNQGKKLSQQAAASECQEKAPAAR